MKYRGTAYSDRKGNYSFKTILPVPYGAGENYRPAHYGVVKLVETYTNDKGEKSITVYVREM